MRCLGIDPSLTCTGLAVINWFEHPTNGRYQILESKSIKTKADQDSALRLHLLYDGVISFVDKWEPDLVAIEGYAMNAKFQRETMGEVGGVIRLALFHKELIYTEYPVRSWRKIALGEGEDKTEIRLRAYQIYGWEIKDHNQLEAALVGVAHYMKMTGRTRPRARRLHGSDT